MGFAERGCYRLTAIFQWISDALSTVVDFIVTASRFLANTIAGLFGFIRNLPKFITYLTASIGYLPSFLSFFAVATVTIAIIYVIIGRGGGKD